MNHRILTRFFVALGIAWFVLWACAPMSSNPPPTPMPEAAIGELTVEIDRGYFKAAEDSSYPIGLKAAEDSSYPMGGVQISARIASGLDKHNEAGFLLLHELGYFGVGGYYRHSLIHDDNISFGMQVDQGMWTGVSLPLAYRVTDEFWLTTMPGASFTWLGGVVRLPVGIAWQDTEHVRLDAEMGINDMFTEGGFYAYGAIGLAFSMGNRQASARDDSPRYQWFR